MKCFSWSLDTVGLFAPASPTWRSRPPRSPDASFASMSRPPAPPVVALRAHASVDRGERRDAGRGRARGARRRALRRADQAARAAADLRARPMRAHRIIQDYEAFRALAFEYDHHRDRLGSDPARAARRGRRDRCRRLRRCPPHHPARPPGVADLLADGEVILTPSAPGAAPHGLGVDRASRPSTGCGRCWAPCVNVPGLVEPGRPAARRADRRALRPGPVRPPPRPSSSRRRARVIAPQDRIANHMVRPRILWYYLPCSPGLSVSG